MNTAVANPYWQNFLGSSPDWYKKDDHRVLDHQPYPFQHGRTVRNGMGIDRPVHFYTCVGTAVLSTPAWWLTRD